MDKDKSIAVQGPIIVGLCAVFVAYCWQFLQVRYLHGNNWTALYYTGALAAVPPELDKEKVYQFPGVIGYDGQAYHIIAHDPLFRRGMGKYIDSPRLRYQRILVPGAAAIIAMGNDDCVDAAYIFVILAFTFLGAFWLARWMSAHNHSAWWGLMFVVMPAAIASTSLLVTDVALAALTAGAIWYAERESHSGLFLTLAGAALVRETGVLVIGAWVAWLVFRRSFREAALYCAAFLPVAAWFYFVQQHTAPSGRSWLSLTPFAGLVHSFSHPFEYAMAAGKWLLALDRIALSGMIVAFGLVLYDLVRRGKWSFARFITFAYTALAAILNDPTAAVWPEVTAFGRIFTPFLLAFSMPAMASGNWWRLTPLILVVPRMLIITAAQLVSVVRAVIAGGL